jgi:UDPglucose 6-dehydrogenase
MNSRLRLTVLGTGYLGITHAACMASQGFEVLGVDTDAQKVARLSAGELPVFEPGAWRSSTLDMTAAVTAFSCGRG